MRNGQKLACAATLAIASFSTNAFGNLLLHYTFDEAASGTTAALDSGSVPAANGSFGGGSTRTAGNLSAGAFDTNGGVSTNYLSAGDAAKLDGLTQITVTAWINLQASPGQYDRIVADHDATSGWELSMENPSSGVMSASNFRLSFAVDTVAGPLSANVSANNQWLFVAATYDGSKLNSNVNLFVGGLASGVVISGGVNQTIGAGASNLNSTDFRIGSTARTTNDRTPDAFIDDVRVYNEVLTLAQLDSVRMTSVPEPTSLGLIALGGMGLLRRRR